MAAGDDGSLRAARSVPELEPGLYWLTIKTMDGTTIAARTFWVLAGAGVSEPGTSAAATADFSLSLLGYATVAAVLLTALLSVWWMWRKPKEESEEKKAPSPGIPEE